MRDKKTQRPRGNPLVAAAQVVPVGVAMWMCWGLGQTAFLMEPCDVKTELASSSFPSIFQIASHRDSERARERERERESESHARNDVRVSRRHGVCVDRTQEVGGSKCVCVCVHWMCYMTYESKPHELVISRVYSGMRAAGLKASLPNQLPPNSENGKPRMVLRLQWTSSSR